MFKTIDLQNQLIKLQVKSLRNGQSLVEEANRVLKKDLFTEDKILENLKQYNKSNELISEEDVDANAIFSIRDIKQLCIDNRLKFLESKYFKQEIPYEAILKIKALNKKHCKEIKYFKILASPISFTASIDEQCFLFAKTDFDNYFLIHKWGKPFKWNRQLKYWHLRKFENLFLTILFVTSIITLSLPTNLITLDHSAHYWSGYRAAAFFHLLIFNTGVTAYITFAFGKNFNSSIWNKAKDFD